MQDNAVSAIVGARNRLQSRGALEREHPSVTTSVMDRVPVSQGGVPFSEDRHARRSRQRAEPRCAIAVLDVPGAERRRVVAGARNHLKANRPLEFSFEIMI